MQEECALAASCTMRKPLDLTLQGQLHGIVTVEQGAMAGLKTDAVNWGSDVKKVVALCHDIVPLSKGQLVGSLEEKKAFAAVEAAFMVGSTGLCNKTTLWPQCIRQGVMIKQVTHQSLEEAGCAYVTI